MVKLLDWQRSSRCPMINRPPPIHEPPVRRSPNRAIRSRLEERFDPLGKFGTLDEARVIQTNHATAIH